MNKELRIKFSQIISCHEGSFNDHCMTIFYEQRDGERTHVHLFEMNRDFTPFIRAYEEYQDTEIDRYFYLGYSMRNNNMYNHFSVCDKAIDTKKKDYNAFLNSVQKLQESNEKLIQQNEEILKRLSALEERQNKMDEVDLLELRQTIQQLLDINSFNFENKQDAFHE